MHWVERPQASVRELWEASHSLLQPVLLQNAALCELHQCLEGTCPHVPLWDLAAALQCAA
jgi:hypothetical protein